MDVRAWMVVLMVAGALVPLGTQAAPTYHEKAFFPVGHEGDVVATGSHFFVQGSGNVVREYASPGGGHVYDWPVNGTLFAVAGNSHYVAAAVLADGGGTPLLYLWHDNGAGWDLHDIAVLPYVPGYATTYQWLDVSVSAKKVALAAYSNQTLDIYVYQLDNGAAQFEDNFRTSGPAHPHPLDLNIQGDRIALSWHQKVETWAWSLGGWTSTGSVLAPSGGTQQFGTSVLFRQDPNNVLLVGDPGWQQGGTQVGRVFRYEWAPGSSSWVSMAPLEHPADVHSSLGHSLAMASIGGHDYVVAGAPAETHHGHEASGAVYLYKGAALESRWWLCDAGTEFLLGLRVFLSGAPTGAHTFPYLDGYGTGYNETAGSRVSGVYDLDTGSRTCSHGVGSGGSGSGPDDEDPGTGDDDEAGDDASGGSHEGASEGDETAGEGDGSSGGEEPEDGTESGSGDAHGTQAGHSGYCKDDADCDGILDHDDNCPAHPDQDLRDSDGDGAGDACDATPHGQAETKSTDDRPSDEAQVAASASHSVTGSDAQPPAIDVRASVHGAWKSEGAGTQAAPSAEAHARVAPEAGMDATAALLLGVTGFLALAAVGAGVWAWMRR